MDNYGLLSLLPPLVAIVLCITALQQSSLSFLCLRVHLLVHWFCAAGIRLLRLSQRFNMPLQRWLTARMRTFWCLPWLWAAILA